MIEKEITLNNGNKMPMQGFGTLQITDEKLCEQYVYDAIKEGIRMIDTAPAYFNEAAVGSGIARAIRDKIVTREELFVVTKLWIQDTPANLVRTAVESSMEKLQVDYIDLYLIHQPYGSYLEAWPVMEELSREGILKNIGVCNFYEEKLEELLSIAKIKPAVNQIEIHPYFLHEDLVDYMKKEGILPMAWGSLFEGQGDIFSNEKIAKIGEQYHKSTAQVILRWHLERKTPALFKTIQKGHLREDINIWDFALTTEEQAVISSFDQGYSQIIDHRSPRTKKWLSEWKIHD